MAPDSGSESSPWKYFPFELGECEELENYEPGGFHPVHLGDVYDGQYEVVHKLYFGGFSTVWLARATRTNRWVALKIVEARASPTYEDRCVIASHKSVAQSGLFVTAFEKFWIEGPNGRHLCLVSPVLGPDLSRLSKGIYSRLTAPFARELSLQAARALAQLHGEGLCHGDFTASNMVLRLVDGFDAYDQTDVLNLFGRPQTAPLRTYSGKPPWPHGPDYIVVPLDFCSSTTTVLSSDICIIDFDQSFRATDPPAKRPGIPAKYLAPEVAVGGAASPASDVWALGCAIFRIRSGDDLFFDYDTNSPFDALIQMVKALGEVPEPWRTIKFDEDGEPVSDEEEGEVLWDPGETRALEDRVRDIVDEPPGLFVNERGEVVGPPDAKPARPMFRDHAVFRVPYPAVLSPMVWKPTAICVDGSYFESYSDEQEVMMEAFPKISESEASSLTDLLLKIFTYEPAARSTAEELVRHPWFQPATSSG